MWSNVPHPSSSFFFLSTFFPPTALILSTLESTLRCPCVNWYRTIFSGLASQGRYPSRKLLLPPQADVGHQLLPSWGWALLSTSLLHAGLLAGAILRMSSTCRHTHPLRVDVTFMWTARPRKDRFPVKVRYPLQPSYPVTRGAPEARGEGCNYGAWLFSLSLIIKMQLFSLSCKLRHSKRMYTAQENKNTKETKSSHLLWF